jgi:hypothetical protein
MANEFKPGNIVPFSGIYEVVHSTRHAKPQDVTCIAGDPFPICRNCTPPRFILKRKARYVQDNRSFNKT